MQSTAVAGAVVVEPTSTGCGATGTSPWAIVAIVILIVAPLIVAGYLYRASGRTTEAG